MAGAMPGHQEVGKRIRYLGCDKKAVNRAPETYRISSSKWNASEHSPTHIARVDGFFIVVGGVIFPVDKF